MRKLLGAAIAAALALIASGLRPALAQTTGTYTSPNNAKHESQGVEVIGKDASGQRCVVGIDPGCVGDPNNGSFDAPVQLTVGAAALATPVRAIDAECTAGGTATVTFATGVPIVWQVGVGHQSEIWKATGVSATGGGAACTFYGLTK